MAVYGVKEAWKDWMSLTTTLTMVSKRELQRRIERERGRFWTKYVDVYWGPDCVEIFNCSWCVVSRWFSFEWMPGIMSDEDGNDQETD